MNVGDAQERWNRWILVEGAARIYGGGWYWYRATDALATNPYLGGDDSE